MHEEGRREVEGADVQSQTPQVDAEIDVRRIVQFGVGLALTMAMVLCTVWLLSVWLKERQQARDPEQSPLAEANLPRPPPEPRIQTSPSRDLEKLRAEEKIVLSTYGWTDRQAGIGRIPIERAIDILTETGLPVTAPTQVSPSPPQPPAPPQTPALPNPQEPMQPPAPPQRSPAEVGR